MNRTGLKHLSRQDLINDKIVYLSPGHAPCLVSTLGPAGNVNVGTFEQAMVVSYQPPRIMLAIAPTCDTYLNLREGSDCVVGFPRPESIQAAYDCGIKLPREDSELDVVSGLATRPSRVVRPPSIRQCWINVECRLVHTMPAGDHAIVLLDVVHASLDEEVWSDDRVQRRNQLPAVYYTTSGHFFTAGRKFKVELSSPLRRYKNGD